MVFEYGLQNLMLHLGGTTIIVSIGIFPIPSVCLGPLLRDLQAVATWIRIDQSKFWVSNSKRNETPVDSTQCTSLLVALPSCITIETKEILDIRSRTNMYVVRMNRVQVGCAILTTSASNHHIWWEHRPELRVWTFAQSSGHLQYL